MYILLKTVAFIAGKKNPATQKNIIHFSIEIKLLKNDFKDEIASKTQFRPIECINTDGYNQIFNGKMNKRILGCWIFYPQ